MPIQISVFGQTDKRAVIYTLLKACYRQGEVLYVTNDRKAQRLMDEGEHGEQGTYGSVTVAITDATADELWNEIQAAPIDYDFIILDNLYDDNTNLCIYVKGAGDEADDAYLFDTFEADELVVIKMGNPDKAVKGGPKVYNIPYSKEMIQAIENCEFYHRPQPICPQATSAICDLLAPKLNMTAKNLAQVVNRK